MVFKFLQSDGDFSPVCYPLFLINYTSMFIHSLFFVSLFLNLIDNNGKATHILFFLHTLQCKLCAGTKED